MSRACVYVCDVYCMCVCVPYTKRACHEHTVDAENALVQRFGSGAEELQKWAYYVSCGTKLQKWPILSAVAQNFLFLCVFPLISSRLSLFAFPLPSSQLSALFLPVFFPNFSFLSVCCGGKSSNPSTPTKTSHSTGVHYTTLNHTTLNYTARHCTALNYTLLFATYMNVSYVV